MSNVVNARNFAKKKRPLRYTNSRYLVFANSGSLLSQEKWANGLKNTDLIIYYQGDNKKNYEKYLSFATYVIKHNL